MHRTAAFTSTYPDDWRFDEAENPVEPGALDLARAIVSGLLTRVDSITEIEQYSYFGWGFEVTFAGYHFFNVLNPADECYLTVSLRWEWLWRLLLQRPDEAFDRYCRVLDEALAELPRVSGVRWKD